MNDQRIILHVDLNSFFATAEQQTNPRLRGRPVGVIKAPGRTVIIAASVAAKRFGVKTGSNVFEARRFCPSLILVPADFAKYEKMTYRFIRICQTYSPLCEVFSLDECFIDVTETAHLFGGVLAIAARIKARLRQEVGDYMACSVGISHNRLLAKLASGQIKPDGLFIINRDNVIEVLDRSDLMDICGVGFALNRHLRALGIDSFPKLRATPLTFLRERFGPYWSCHLYNIARGIDDSPVVASSDLPDAKSVSRTYTTHRDLHRPSEIWRLVRNLGEEAAAKARQMGMAGRYVGLVLRSGRIHPGGGEFQPVHLRGEVKETAGQHLEGGIGDGDWSGHKTLKTYLNDGKSLFDICRQIGSGWPIKSMRFCGVTLGMLAFANNLTIPLFASDRRRENLVKSVDVVNRRFGDYTLFPAQLLGTSIIRPEVNGYFGDKKFRLSFKESP